MRTRSVLAMAAAVTMLAVSACGGDDTTDGGDDAAAPDKKVTVYSGRSENLVKPLLDQFQTATGITVEARYGDTAQMAAQLLEEGERTPADVFLAQDAGALGLAAKNNLFAPLPQDLLDKVSQEYRATDGKWVGVTGRSRVLVYNPDLVPAATLPASVFDLTGPAWKGKVGIAPTNASFQAFVTAVRVQHGDAKAKEFLTGLKANDVQIREKNGQIVDDVAAGTLATGLVNHYYVYEKAGEAGTPVDQLKAKLHFFPAGDSGALVNVSGVGVLTNAADDPDAKALVEYLLGADAQKYFAEQTYEYPMASGVAPATGLPALTELKGPEIDLNDLDTLEATVGMIKEAGLA